MKALFTNMLCGTLLLGTFAGAQKPQTNSNAPVSKPMPATGSSATPAMLCGLDQTSKSKTTAPSTGMTNPAAGTQGMGNMSGGMSSGNMAGGTNSSGNMNMGANTSGTAETPATNSTAPMSGSSANGMPSGVGTDSSAATTGTTTGATTPSMGTGRGNMSSGGAAQATQTAPTNGNSSTTAPAPANGMPSNDTMHTGNGMNTGNDMSSSGAAKGSQPSSDAQNTTMKGAQMGSGALNSTDKCFAEQAALSDQFEIQSSRLALTQASDGGVKAMAKQLIQDHTKASQKLSAVAMKSGLRLPTTLSGDKDKKAKVDALRASKGMAFDHAYVSAQVMAHEQAVNLFRAYIQSGTNPQLRAHATQTLPALEHHLQAARKLSTSLKH